MQINENKIAFFYYRLFFRIEIFQWVTGDSNKKIPPRRLRPQRAIDPTASIPLLHPCLQAGHPAGLRCRGKTNSINFGFAEEIVCWRTRRSESRSRDTIISVRPLGQVGTPTIMCWNKLSCAVLFPRGRRLPQLYENVTLSSGIADDPTRRPRLRGKPLRRRFSRRRFSRRRFSQRRRRIS